MKLILFVILSTFSTSNAFAFDHSFFTMVGYGSLEKKAGAEISLGVQLMPYDWIKLDIAPFTGLFRRKNDPRYSRVKDDKQLSCRDNTSGEFVDNKYCGINFEYAFESSVKFPIFRMLDIGAGARIADRTIYYGVAVFRFNHNLGLEGKVGDDYTSALFRIDF